MAKIKHNIQYKITAKDLSKGAFKKLNNAFPSIQSAAIAGTAAIAGLGFGVIKATQHFSEFETEVVNLGKVTSLPIEGLKRRILDMSPALGTAKSLTQGLYQTISAGVTEPNKAFALLTAAAKTSKAAHIELDTTVKAITKVMAGYGDEIKSAADASDLLFAIERSGQTSVAELAEHIGGLASISAKLKVSTTELGGAFSTLTLTAGNTAEAATQYKAIMTALIKPSTEMQTLLKDLGFDEASQAIGKLGFAGLLEKLAEKTDGSTQALGKLFGKQRAVLGVTQLLSQNMGPLTEKIKDVGDRAGLSEKAFDDFKFTIKGLYETFKSVVGGIVIEVMDKLAPDIKTGLFEITKSLQESKGVIIAYAAKFIESVKEVLDTTDVSFTDVVKLAFWMAEKMAVAALKTVDAISSITKALLLVKKETDPTYSALDKFFKDIGRIGSSFVFGFEGDVENAVGITGYLGGALRGLSIAAEEIINTVKAAFWALNSVVEYIIYQAIVPAFNYLITVFDDVVTAINTGFGDRSPLDLAADRVANVAREFSAATKVVGPAAQQMASSISDAMEGAIEGPKTLNETLKEVVASFEPLHEFKIDTEDGILKISNVKKELDPDAWKEALNKKVWVNTTDAITSIGGVRNKLGEIPQTTTKILEVDTVNPEMNLDTVLDKYKEIDKATEKQRVVIIDVKPAIAALDELIERFKKLNDIRGLKHAKEMDANGAIGNEALNGVTLFGRPANEGFFGQGYQNINIHSNVNVDAGDQDPESLARGIDDELSRNIQRGQSKIPDALNNLGR